MRLMVLDNVGSFSLVPYLREAHKDWQIFSMANIATDQMWEIFKKTDPDVVFCDFCNENAVDLTRRVKDLAHKPKIVIRLHRYEVNSWYMQKIDWSQVSFLMTVSPKFKELVKAKKVLPGPQIHVVHNGIDLDKFKLQDDAAVDNKSISYVGYFNQKKGLALLRVVMASMPERKFYLAGAYQDDFVKLYMEDLELPNAIYCGWSQTEQFLLGKRFLISTSLTESFGMGIAEAMAMGCTPLVHHWPGADDLWPKDCLWNTFEELKKIGVKDPAWCRQWIVDRYSMEICINKVVQLLSG